MSDFMHKYQSWGSIVSESVCNHVCGQLTSVVVLSLFGLPLFSMGAIMVAMFFIVSIITPLTRRLFDIIGGGQKQTRLMSIAETMTGKIVAQLLATPLLMLAGESFTESGAIGVIMISVGILRQYAIRRIFNHHTHRSIL